MTTLSLRLPDSYHAMVKEITAKEEISINQHYIRCCRENFCFGNSELSGRKG